MNVVFSLVALFGFLFGVEGGSKRYSTNTGSYTDETIDDVLDAVETDEDLFGRDVGLDDSSSYSDCADKLSCYQDDIEEDYIYCEGYYSCYEAELVADQDAFLDGCRAGQEAEVVAENDIYCGGYCGCFTGFTLSQGDTICDGLYGCYNNELYSSKDFYLLGYRATTAAEIYGNGTSDEDNVYALGLYAGLYSILDYASNIYAYGMGSMYFADVFTTDVSDFTMVNYGRYATNYGQLYCSHKTTCYVYCRDTGCYNFEVRVARKSYVYVYYEDSSCDSELSVITAISSDDEMEWQEMYQQRKKMKRQARKEFKKKYGRDILEYSSKEYEELNIEKKFAEIIERIHDRMGLIDGKTRKVHESDKRNKIIAKSGNSNSQFSVSNGVIHVSEHFNQNNKFSFNWQMAGYGTISGVVLLAIIMSYKKFFGNNNNNKLLGNNYSYQSI